MTKPGAMSTRWQRALWLLGAGSLPFGACTDGAGPDPEGVTKAVSQSVTATASRIAGNAVYQVRKESGASAYDATSNTSFITYNGPNMDIYVRAYDNAASTWGPLTLARRWTHYDCGVKWSYHNYSTMVLGPDGRLHVFQADHGHALYEIVAPGAHSIAGTWAEKQISSDYNAYPSVNVVGNSIYLVYVRDYSGTPDTYRTLRFIRKTWNGSAWS